MKTISIPSVEALIRQVNELPNNFIYRGQADSAWPLKSSLERVIGAGWNTEKAQKFEDYALQLRISANVTGDFGNVTGLELGAGLRA